MIDRLRNKFQGSSLGATVLKAVAGSAGIRIAGMGCSFVVGVLLARGMGAEGYGIYGVAMSIIALLTVPTEFGMPQLLTREVATAHAHRRWGMLRGVLQWAGQTSFVISLVILIGVVAWLLLSGQGIQSSLGRTLMLGMVLVPLVAFVSQRSAALRGMQQIVSGQLPDVLLRPATHAALAVVFVAAVPLTPAMSMGLGVFAAAVALVVAETMLRRALPSEVRKAPPEKHAKVWWCSAIPMAMTEGMRMLQGHMLLLMLGWLVPMAEVGIFRMASSVMQLVAMPVSLLNIVSMPIVARLYASGDLSRLQRMLPLVALGMTMGMLVLTLPFIVGGETLLAAVFGKQFAAGNLVLLVLCLAMLPNALFGAVAILLTMAGHQAQVTKASLLSVVILFVVAWPLIAFYGAIGAAIANLIAFIPWNIVMWRYAKDQLQLDASVWPLLKKPLMQRGQA
jgi:O-antigen/teichoic acid export membrane protein